MKWNNKLKIYREKLGLSQKYIAEEIVNKKQQTYGRWEAGDNEPDIESLHKLADLFEVSIDELTAYDKKNNSDNELARINVLGSIPAGVPVEAVEDIVDWEEIPAEWLKKGEYFALRIKGDSMSPTFLDGDIVVFKKQPDVDSGEYAAVFVNGYDATFKKVIKNESGNIILQPLNTDYDPIYVNQDEYFQILGKPVQARRNFY